jgi:rod shape-determining protein MreC
VGPDTRRTRIVLALLLLTSFTLIAVDVRGGDSSPMHPVRSFAGTVFGPVEKAASAVVRPVSDAIDDIKGLRGNEDRIAALEAERDRLRLELRTSELARARAAELDKLLRVASVGRYKVLPAQVIAIGPAQGFSWTVTIDAGSRDGLRVDMTVLNGDGLVGRIKNVSSSTSTVLLAADPSVRVGVRLERTLHVGVATGRGAGLLEVELLEPQAALAVGDRFVTFGSRGGLPYVAGVPVGEVVSVKGVVGSLTKQATVKPYADFTALDLVGVVVEPPRTDPRDAVLPPAPAKTPTPKP